MSNATIDDLKEAKSHREFTKEKLQNLAECLNVTWRKTWSKERAFTVLKEKVCGSSDTCELCEDDFESLNVKDVTKKALLDFAKSRKINVRVSDSKDSLLCKIKAALNLNSSEEVQFPYHPLAREDVDFNAPCAPMPSIDILCGIPCKVSTDIAIEPPKDLQDLQQLVSEPAVEASAPVATVQVPTPIPQALLPQAPLPQTELPQPPVPQVQLPQHPVPQVQLPQLQLHPQPIERIEEMEAEEEEEQPLPFGGIGQVLETNYLTDIRLVEIGNWIRTGDKGRLMDLSMEEWREFIRRVHPDLTAAIEEAATKSYTERENEMSTLIDNLTGSFAPQPRLELQEEMIVPFKNLEALGKDSSVVMAFFSL